MMDVIARVSTSLLTFKIPVRASKTITKIVKGVLGKTLGKMYTIFARSLIKICLYMAKQNCIIMAIENVGKKKGFKIFFG